MEKNMINDRVFANVQEKDVFNTVMSFYRNNSYKSTNLSDTWEVALDRKGRLYTNDEMERMLSAGSRVSSLILDWSFMIDRNQLDLNDQYLRKILENGETDIGNPHKNNLIGGKYYSSGFLRNAISAAQLIKALDQKGFQSSPRILEIGGGTGQLQCILKKYYGENITLYSVDLPETLIIQAWYLLRHFPESRYAYKTSEHLTELVSNGLNFINAYCLESQNFAFDAVINIASMQEMTKETVEKYFSFIQKNISSNGVFLFKNCFGHATDSIVSPSDYPFDEYWIAEDVSIAHSSEILVHPGEFLNVLLSRSKTPQDQKKLKLTLRYIWNGLQTKHLIRNQVKARDMINKIDELLRIPSNIDRSVDFSQLKNDYYLTEDAFCDPDKIPDFRTIIIEDRPDAFVKLTAQAQGEMVCVLKKYLQTDGRTDSDILKVKKRITARLHKAFEEYFRGSDYEARYITAMLIGLGSHKQAENIIKYRLIETKNIFEEIHYFYLLNDMHQLENYRSRLSNTVDQGVENDISRVQVADLILMCDCNSQMADRFFLKQKEFLNCTDYVKYLMLKVLLKHKRYDEEEMILKCFENMTFLSVNQIWNLFFEYGNDLKLNRTYIFDQLRNILKKTVKEDIGQLLIDCLEHSKPAMLFKDYLARSKIDFFKLGRLARLLFKYKLNNLADKCLEDSVCLRPDNFKHYCYVAELYFINRMYAKAKHYFEKALHITPYFNHLIYRKYYCDVSLSKQEEGLFTTPDKIDALMLGQSGSYLSFLNS